MVIFDLFIMLLKFLSVPSLSRILMVET